MSSKSKKKKDIGRTKSIAGLTLANPVTYTANQIISFFETDKQVTFNYSYKRRRLSIYVDNVKKAEALAEILNSRYEFSKDLALDVVVYPANSSTRIRPGDTALGTEEDYFNIMKTAFKGNSNIKKFSIYIDPLTKAPFYFCECAKKVIQFLGDNIGNPYGAVTMTTEDLLKEIIDSQGVFVTTFVK